MTHSLGWVEDLYTRRTKRKIIRNLAQLQSLGVQSRDRRRRASKVLGGNAYEKAYTDTQRLPTWCRCPLNRLQCGVESLQDHSLRDSAGSFERCRVIRGRTWRLSCIGRFLFRMAHHRPAQAHRPCRTTRCNVRRRLSHVDTRHWASGVAIGHVARRPEIEPEGGRSCRHSLTSMRERCSAHTTTPAGLLVDPPVAGCGSPCRLRVGRAGSALAAARKRLHAGLLQSN